MGLRPSRTRQLLIGVILAFGSAPGAHGQSTPTSTLERRLDYAYSFLEARIDRHTSSGPRLAQTYGLPFPTGTQFRADLYSNALTILALLSRGRPADLARAKDIGDGIILVQMIDPGNNTNPGVPAPDGRVRDAYWSTSLLAPPPTGGPSMFERGSSTGNLGWAIIALVELHNATQDPKYLTSASWMGDFIDSTYRSSQGLGGFLLGYVTNWALGPPHLSMSPSKSMENNMAAYIAFKRLFAAQGLSKWNSAAQHALSFVSHPSMYTAGSPGSPGHYWVGTTSVNGQDVVNTSPLQQALDVNAYAHLIGLSSNAVPWVEQQTATTHHGFMGFDYNVDTDGVWFEGTSVMTLVYGLVGSNTKRTLYLGELRRAQATAAPPHKHPGALTSACHAGVTTGFTWEYFSSPDITATSWYILAEHAVNPLRP